MKKTILLLILCKTLVAEEPWIETTLANEKLGVDYYTMREEIGYVEFRKALFNNDTNKQVSEKYIPYFVIAKKKLDLYPKKVVKTFRKLKFQKNNLRVATFYASTRHHALRVNGFILDKDSKMWIINEAKDVAWVFNGIDTFAEFIAFLQITNHYFSNSIKENNRYIHKVIYRKVNDGYEYKIYGETKTDFHKDESMIYETREVTIYHLTKDGELSSRVGKADIKKIPYIPKQYKDGKEPELEPVIHPDPVWAFHSEAEMVENILDDDEFITP